MSENILVDGRPLHLLRVVDLRDELKKRGIKATGTKSHLQELLISAITSVQDSNELKDTKADEQNKAEKDATSNEDNSNASSDNNSESEPKVASISINEEKETIKLTIRSSPRKSEPPPQPEKAESETESSQSDTDSNSSPRVEKDDNIDGKHDSPATDIENADDDNSISEPVAIESTSDQVKDVPIEQNKSDDTASKSVNHDIHHVSDNQVKQNFTSDETREETKQIDKSPVKSKQEDLKPVLETGLSRDDQPKKLDKSRENDSNCKPVVPATQSTPPAEKVAGKKRETPEPVSTERTTSRRRLLSQSKSSVEKVQKVDEPEQESKSKTSIRGRLLSHSKSVNEEDSSKPLQKKRRWGSSKTDESSVLKKGISSDELKQLISESVVVTSDSSSTKVSKAIIAEDESVQPTNDLTNNEPETKEEVKKVDVEFKPSTDTNTSIISTKKIVVKEKENQIESPKEPESVERSLSPAKNPESTVLFVTGLVRPYTLPQLKKLLNANGLIDEEKFWIDKIKSKCYVVYSTIEEATKTRATLHNLKWPQSSPKNLSVEFATLEDIDRCLHPENYEDLPLKTISSPAKPPVNDKSVHTTTKKEKDSVIEISKGKYDIILNEPAVRDGKPQAKNSTKDDASSRNVREWDRAKVNLSNKKEGEEQESRKRARHSSEREPPIQEKKEKIRERSKTPEKIKRNDEAAAPREAIKKSESPAKMLEDLFRKTKAAPYIYWLPLSEEQAIERQKQREVVEKERQARIAARRESDSKRENPIQNRPTPNFPRDRPKFQDFRRRSPSPQSRRKRSISPLPRKNARHSRSRSPDRRRFSPRRRR